jgi:hypothetical protein
VDNVLAGQSVAARNFRLSQTERGKQTAFRIQLWTCYGMYRQVNAAVPYHFLVGSINDSIDLHLGYILSDNLKGHRITCFTTLLIITPELLS